MIEFQNRHVKLPDGSPVVVCRIKGSIDGATLQQFDEKLLGFLEQGVKHLIIVFSQVRYINSTGMGVLVKVADRFQAVGGDFHLVDVPDKMVALFSMLGLLQLIKLTKTEEDALKSFQQKKTGTPAGKGQPSTPKPVIPPSATPKQPVPAVTPKQPVPTVAPKQPVLTERKVTASIPQEMAADPSKTSIKNPTAAPKGTTQKIPLTPSAPANIPAPNIPGVAAPKGTTQKIPLVPGASNVPATVPAKISSTSPGVSPNAGPQAVKAKDKVYIISCKKCNSKVSLGIQLRAGSYKCPRCMAIFKVLSTGDTVKIEFL